jgi:hypothetical protein
MIAVVIFDSFRFVLTVGFLKRLQRMTAREERAEGSLLATPNDQANRRSR